MYSIYSKLPPLSTPRFPALDRPRALRYNARGCGPGPGINLAVYGPAAINGSLEPKFMVSNASRTAPRHPGRVVLMGAGPQGLDPGAAS